MGLNLVVRVVGMPEIVPPLQGGELLGQRFLGPSAQAITLRAYSPNFDLGWILLAARIAGTRLEKLTR